MDVYTGDASAGDRFLAGHAARKSPKHIVGCRLQAFSTNDLNQSVPSGNTQSIYSLKDLTFALTANTPERPNFHYTLPNIAIDMRGEVFG